MLELVLISPEGSYKDEISLVEKCLGQSSGYYHLRKPGWSESEVRVYLQRLHPSFHPQITLHDHHVLCREFNVGGLHFNQRFPFSLEFCDRVERTSQSCHSLEEIKTSNEFNYSFLSPLFNSISSR